MSCPTCGSPAATADAACPACGAPPVAPDALDSLVSMEAEPALDDLDEPEEPASFRPLPVALDGEVPAGPDADGAIGGWSVAAPSAPPAPSWEAPPPPVAPAPGPSTAPAVAPGPPLPQRTPLAETEPRWGPRAHPPAVMAPPSTRVVVADPASPDEVSPAASLDLPPAPSMVAPTAVEAAPEPSAAPATASVAAAPVAPAPAPTGRARKWFGRGSSSTGDGGVPGAPLPAPAPTSAGPSGPPGFPGAPEGLLVGVVPEADRGEGEHDPAGLRAVLEALPNAARRSAQGVLAVVSAVLEPGEAVEAAVLGAYQHRPGMALLTDRRVVVANDRRWAPDVRTFALDPRLVVHGWQDDRRATLVFVVDGTGFVVDDVADVAAARELAQAVRARCAGGAPGH